MKLTVIEYGGEPRQIECESFEFRCNHVTNWIRAMHADGSEEMVHDVCVIKADKNDPKTGHWIEHEHNGIAHIECSKCLSWFLRSHLLRNSYCPNCGAEMRGE